MRMNLVFRDTIDPRDLSRFADSHGWTFQGHHPAVKGAPEELTWVTPAGVGAHLVNDEALGILYLVLENTSLAAATSHDVHAIADEMTEGALTLSTSPS